MRAEDGGSTVTPMRPGDGGSLAETLAALDERKRELDALPPLTSEIYAPARRKLRILADHHSSAIEGNTLTLGETAEYLRSGTRPPGKPEREVMEIQGHDDAVEAVEEALRADQPLTEEFLLRLHRVFRVQDRDRYFEHLTRAATERLSGFVGFVADYCRDAVDPYVRCGCGETIEEPDDTDSEIAAFVGSVRPEGHAGRATVGAMSANGSCR